MRGIKTINTARMSPATGVAVGAMLVVALLTGCSSESAKPAVQAGSGASPAAVAATVVPAPATAAAATPVSSPAASRLPPAAPQGAATPQPAAAGSAAPSAKQTARAALQLDAGMVIAGFQRRQLPVGRIETLTVATDPDHQLGVPGRYTSRVDFQDSSLTVQGNPFDVANGGAVEVFASAHDAKLTQEALTGSGRPAGEVDTLHGTVLLRLSTRLDPAQQSAYGLAVNDVMRLLARQAARTGSAAPAASPAPAGGSTPVPKRKTA